MNEKNYIVLYTSKTGFTKKYAEWISKSLSCDALELKSVKPDDLKGFSKVIYGGWVMGSKISGLDKLGAIYKDEPLLFAVGARTPSKDVEGDLRKANNLSPDAPLFYMPGGLNRKKLGFFLRKMFDMGSKMQAKNNPNEKPDFPMGKDFDNTDEKYIEPLLDFFK